MASVSGVSTISKVFSKLGDNTGSVIPMYVKDFSSDTLTSITYFKNGGKRDGAEKTFEEFGTGVIWLGGIPFIKKHLFDNFIYKKAGLNPEVGAKKLFSGNDKNVAETIEFAHEKAKDLGEKFSEQKDVIENTIKNKKLAKNLALTKFGVSTALTGLALFTLITIKKKRTEQEIEKQVREKRAKELKSKELENAQEKAKDTVLKESLKTNDVYSTFKGNGQKDVSFTGLGTFLMSNPIANTALVDCVITGTRLSQARDGERFEVGLKEFCEIAFIYGLAQPLQKGMEFAVQKIFKKPIKLDYSVLDSGVVKEAIEAEKAVNGSSALLQQAKQIVALAGPEKETQKGIKGLIEKAKSIINHTNKMPGENSKNIINYIFDNNDSEFIDVLKRSGDVSVFKTKEGIEQVSLLSDIDTEKVKATAQHTIDIIEGGMKDADPVKYLKNTKLLKGAAIIANIALSAILIGYLQPKLNLHLRKKLHNGDNTNPAIKNLENEIEQKLSFEGNNKDNK